MCSFAVILILNLSEYPAEVPSCVIFGTRAMNSSILHFRLLREFHLEFKEKRNLENLQLRSKIKTITRLLTFALSISYLKKYQKLNNRKILKSVLSLNLFDYRGMSNIIFNWMSDMSLSNSDCLLLNNTSEKSKNFVSLYFI